MGGGKFLMDGKVWSAEAFRMVAEATLSSSDPTPLASQSGGDGTAPVLIFSDSAGDSADGSQAKTVRVDYIDADGYGVSETLDLDGTSSVATARNAKFVNRITVATCGPDTHGTITASLNGSAQLSIDPSAGQSQTTAFRVPKGKQLRIKALTATSNNANGDGQGGAQLQLRSSYDPQTKSDLSDYNGMPQFVLASWWAGAVVGQFKQPYFCGPVHEGAVVVLVATGGNGYKVAANLDCYLEVLGTLDTV
jgi:hypothetical protein